MTFKAVSRCSGFAASYSGFPWLLAERLCLWLSSLQLLLYIIDWANSILELVKASSTLISKALKVVDVAAKKHKFYCQAEIKTIS